MPQKIIEIMIDNQIIIIEEITEEAADAGVGANEAAEEVVTTIKNITKIPITTVKVVTEEAIGGEEESIVVEDVAAIIMISTTNTPTNSRLWSLQNKRKLNIQAVIG